MMRPNSVFYAVIAAAGTITLAAALGIAVTVRRLRKRRADREWAAGIAQRVHDRQFLEWLDAQFDSQGRVR